MKTLSKILAFFALSFLLISCGSNSTGTNGGEGNENGNGGNLPPEEPTFTAVMDIFNTNCGGSDCHIGESTNGVRLDSYENVMISEGVQYGGPIVVPNEPENSPIVNKISNNNPEFGVRMPNGGPPLSDEEIALIRDWIAEGAQNN